MSFHNLSFLAFNYLLPVIITSQYPEMHLNLVLEGAFRK